MDAEERLLRAIIGENRWNVLMQRADNYRANASTLVPRAEAKRARRATRNLKLKGVTQCATTQQT